MKDITSDIYNLYKKGQLLIRQNDGQTPATSDKINEYIISEINLDKQNPWENFQEIVAPPYGSSVLGVSAIYPIINYSKDIISNECPDFDSRTIGGFILEKYQVNSGSIWSKPTYPLTISGLPWETEANNRGNDLTYSVDVSNGTVSGKNVGLAKYENATSNNLNSKFNPDFLPNGRGGLIRKSDELTKYFQNLSDFKGSNWISLNAHSEWIKLYSESDDKYYYYNEKTNESIWDAPLNHFPKLANYLNTNYSNGIDAQVNIFPSQTLKLNYTFIDDEKTARFNLGDIKSLVLATSFLDIMDWIEYLNSIQECKIVETITTILKKIYLEAINSNGWINKDYIDLPVILITGVILPGNSEKIGDEFVNYLENGYKKLNKDNFYLLGYFNTKKLTYTPSH